VTPSPHFRVLPSSPAPAPAGSELLELESGDSFLIARVAGSVLVTLDDIDDTVCPTARMTQLEARRLATVLTRYADRRQLADEYRHDH
jgi:hypothetical protein